MAEKLSDEDIFMSKETDEVVETPTEEVTAEVETPTEPEKPEEPEVEVKAEAPPEEPQEPEKEEPQAEATVPSWRLREVNEAKALAERQAQEALQNQKRFEAELNQLRQKLAQQEQQPQTVPDMYSDPDGYANYYQQQLQVRDQSVNELQQTLRATTARLEAIAIHGNDAVQQAWSAAEEANKSDPTIELRLTNSPNPWAEAIKWHKEVETQKAIGEGGIEGFEKSIREKLASDPEFKKQIFEEMRGEANGKVAEPKPDVPPSLNDAPRVQTPENGDPLLSDAELFNMR